MAKQKLEMIGNGMAGIRTIEEILERANDLYDITVVVLLAIGIAGFYFWNKTTSYVTTDNAKVNGDQIKIASPASGQIKSLNVKQDDKLDKGDKVATDPVPGQDGETNIK